MNAWNAQTAAQESNPIEILGSSIVLLHKVLKEEDLLKAMRKRDHYGEPVNMVPPIAIDFTTVTSIQEDYKNNGTVVMDRKTAVVVKEPFADVLEVWIEIQNRIQYMYSDKSHEQGSGCRPKEA